MIARIFSATNTGFEGSLIDVECDASNSLPGVLIVGLGNKAIDEARERIRSAIKNSGLDFPRKRITINLAPANLPKDGAHFDLPMAIAILIMGNQINQEACRDILFIGELALDGSLRSVPGVVGHVQTAKEHGIKRIIVPQKNIPQAQLVGGVEVLGANHLRDVYLHLTRKQSLPICKVQPPALPATTRSIFRLADIRGQEQAKRALTIAAAGHHNILLNGPPGAGKTMLAKALLSILPPLSKDEMIEVTKLHSLAGESKEEVVQHRPFRAPHHSASHISLVGGGRNPRPGEISLAHRGVLFLDELPEYSRSALESLRQPLEDKQIHIARVNERVVFPADFMLIATQNPCPCGYANEPEQTCTCGALEILRYQKKISGPLLDRIDLVINVSRVEPHKLLEPEHVKKVQFDAQAQITLARSKQYERFKSSRTNANLTNREMGTRAKLLPEAKLLLDTASNTLKLSARAYFKVIKVARTIADIENSDTVLASHISEALQYRPRPHIGS